MYEEACYATPPLKEVILRLDFGAPIEAFTKSLPQKVATAALHAFPISEPQKAQAQEVVFTGAGMHANSTEFTQWLYHGKNREKTLTIQRDAIVFQHRKYETYEKFKSEAKSIFLSVFDAEKDLSVSRLGLRYINVFEMGDGGALDWGKYINPEMLGAVEFFGKFDNLSRAFHVIEFNHDGHLTKLQYGIANPDYPAPVRRRHFVLDIDSSYQGAIGMAEVDALIDSAHSKIQDLFEKAITEATRAEMGRKE